EKVTSLGKDWHRPCLRCEKCNKTLTVRQPALLAQPDDGVNPPQRAGVLIHPVAD
ncbi:PREDICTED: cysteine-rich protein 1, partial [Tinamus guttatus]|uniref:cysteine-rich protein 1 n=1 Tax=Tinamus guttatus TaxID=94827 RepID=UPI00052ECA91